MRTMKRKPGFVSCLVAAGVFGAASLQAAPVALQNATASVSSSGTTVGTLIDGNPGTSWQVEATDSAAVFETVSDQGTGGPATLTFTMEHTIGAAAGTGKFRLSVTADDRSTFADGLSNGGDVTADWEELTPLSVTCDIVGTTFTINPDNSVLVGGVNGVDPVYTVVAVATLANITGVRMEVLTDGALPGGGPGRFGNSALVMSEFEVDIIPGTLEPDQVALQRATASVSTENTKIGSLIDDLPATYWIVEDVDSSAVFETMSDISAILFMFTMEHSILGAAVGTGKFRLSVTTDDRSTFADGLSNGGDVTADWLELTPLSVTCDIPGTTFTINPDNSVLVGGVNGTDPVYTVVAISTLADITGVRVEVLTDGSLPGGGPGRFGNSALVFSEFKVDIVPGTLEPNQVALQRPTASVSTENTRVGSLIDGVPATYWIVEDLDSAAVFETVSDVGAATFTFTMEHSILGAAVGTGKFRLSVTTDDRGTFADGLSNGGDVTANWTELTPDSVTCDIVGTTFTINPDNTVLVGGVNGADPIYTVVVASQMSGITGFRLEVLTDPSLPATPGGPGRFGNGSLVMSEFKIIAVPAPVPGTLFLLACGLCAPLLRKRT